MKNILALFSFFLALAVVPYSMAAQESKIIVLSCTGLANFSAADGDEEIKLFPGISLPLTGSVLVQDGARARIIVNEKSVLLTGPGRYKLADIHEANTKKSMSFSARFWKFVVSGMGSTEDKKDLVKYHREFMKSHGGIKGFTEVDSSIVLSALVRGNIASDSVVFSWTTDNYKGPCQFRILDDKRNEVFSDYSENRSKNINLNRMGLSFGGKYFWAVSYKNDSKTYNSELEFQYVPHKQSIIVEKLLYLEDYINANANEKTWMKAVILEMEGYFYESDQIYKRLLKEDGNNVFLKKNYALFLCRQNRLKDASDTVLFK